MDVPWTVDDVRRSLGHVGPVDYVVFAVALVVCLWTAVYFGCCHFRVSLNGVDEYFLGARQMKVFPVAMSLVTSCTSGVFLLVTTTEVYLHGAEYMFVSLGLFLAGVIFSYLFLPIFYDCKLTTIYKYLEKRFDKCVYLYGVLLYIVQMVFWLPVVIYVPAIAINNVTGFNVEVVVPCICSICILYTCIGGLRTVIWTSLVQCLTIVSVLLVVLFKGTHDVGGASIVVEKARLSGRLDHPSWSVDPTTRHSVWSLTLGGMLYWLQTGCLNQTSAQRFLALPSLKHARWTIVLCNIGIKLLLVICCCCGLLEYTVFYDCDPLRTRLVEAGQLLPLLVMKTLGQFPGLPGLFAAGVFGASLSCLSAGLNSMAAVVLEDVCKPWCGGLGKWWTFFIARGTVACLGIVYVVLLHSEEWLKTILQISTSMIAMVSGPALALFVCGLLLPWINEKGVLFGSLTGLLFSASLIFGAQNVTSSGEIRFSTKPTSVEGCNYYYNITGFDPYPLQQHQTREVFPLLKISYMWYTAVGLFVSIVTALMVSYCTRFNDLSRINPKLVSPVIRCILPKPKSVALLKQELKLLQILKANPIISSPPSPYYHEVEYERKGPEF